MKGIDMGSAKSVAVCGCIVLGMTCALSLEPAHGQGSAKATYCDGFARDYARRNSAGAIIESAAVGAIGGAIIGGIVGGKSGAGEGAAIGAGTGALAGAAGKGNYQSQYKRAFTQCMRG
jgi:hypothetical protein